MPFLKIEYSKTSYGFSGESNWYIVESYIEYFKGTLSEFSILDDNEKFKSHGIWYDILLKNEKVGDMTCGIWSNRLEKNIGLSLVSIKVQPGDKVSLNKEGRIYSATMAELPFI